MTRRLHVWFYPKELWCGEFCDVVYSLCPLEVNTEEFFLLFVLDPSSNNESDLGNNKVLGSIVYFNEDIDFW